MFKSARGRHRRPSKNKPAILAATGLTAALMGGEMLVTAGPASAATGWDAVAQCESGGNAKYNDGQFYGLYNFDRQTWQGLGYSGTADQYPASVQTQAAERLYAQRGSQPWPVCGKYLSGGSTAASHSYARPAAPAAAKPAAPAKVAAAARPAGPAKQAAAVKSAATSPYQGKVLTTDDIEDVRSDVRALQAKLAGKGYKLAIDGQYGPETEGVVTAFQHKAGIAEDGMAGPQTFRALFG